MIEKDIIYLKKALKNLKNKIGNIDLNSCLVYYKLNLKNIEIYNRFSINDYYTINMKINFNDISKFINKKGENIKENNHNLINSLNFLRDYSNLIKKYGNNVCKSSNLLENNIKYNKGIGINSLSPVSILTNEGKFDFYLYDLIINEEKKYIEFDFIQMKEKLMQINSRLIHKHTKDLLHSHCLYNNILNIIDKNENNINNCTFIFTLVEELGDALEDVSSDASEGNEGNEGDEGNEGNEDDEDDENDEEITNNLNSKFSRIKSSLNISSKNLKIIENAEDYEINPNIENFDGNIEELDENIDVNNSEGPNIANQSFTEKLMASQGHLIGAITIFPGIITELVNYIEKKEKGNKKPEIKNNKLNKYNIPHIKGATTKSGILNNNINDTLPPPPPPSFREKEESFSRVDTFIPISSIDEITNNFETNVNPILINSNFNRIFEILNNKTKYVHFNNHNQYYFNIIKKSNSDSIGKEKNIIYKQIENLNIIYRDTYEDLNNSVYKLNNSLNIYEKNEKKRNNEELYKIKGKKITFKEIDNISTNFENYIKKYKVIDKLDIELKNISAISQIEIDEFKKDYELNSNLILTNDDLILLINNVKYYYNRDFNYLSLSDLSYNYIFELLKLFLKIYTYKSKIFFNILSKYASKIINFNDIINIYKKNIDNIIKKDKDIINKTIIFVLEKYELFNNVYNKLYKYYFYKNFSELSISNYTKQYKYKNDIESLSNIIGRSELIRNPKSYQNVDIDYYLYILENQSKLYKEIFGNHSFISYIDYESFEITNNNLSNFYNNINSIFYIIKQNESSLPKPVENELEIIYYFEKYLKYNRKNCAFSYMSNYVYNSLIQILSYNLNDNDLKKYKDFFLNIKKIIMNSYKTILYNKNLEYELNNYKKIINNIPSYYVRLNNSSVNNFKYYINNYKLSENVNNQKINYSYYKTNINNINTVSTVLSSLNKKKYIKISIENLNNLNNLKYKSININKNSIPYSFCFTINITKQILYLSSYLKKNIDSKNCKPFLKNINLILKNKKILLNKLLIKYNNFKNNDNNKSKRLDAIFKNLKNEEYQELLIPDPSNNIKNLNYNNFILILVDNKKEIGYIGSIKL